MNKIKIKLYVLTSLTHLTGAIVHKTTGLIKGPESYYASIFLVFTVLTIAEIGHEKQEVEKQP